MHWFPVLIQSRTAYLYDCLIRLGTRWQDFQDLAFHVQRVTRAGRLGPREFTAQADDAVAQRQASIHKKAHGNGCGVPSAGRQPAKHAGLRSCFIQMERLRIKLPGKTFNLLFCYVKRAGSEFLARGKIFQVESRLILD